MLRLPCSVLFLSGLLSVLSSRQAEAQTFTISGTVVEHGSNKPLKDATVTLAPVGQDQPPASYQTGDDGRFTFPQLQAGKYSLGAQKRGFPPQTFEEYQGYSTAIVAGPGLDSANVVFPLSAGGSITGTVLDEENEGIRQAQVLLFSKEVYGGAVRILMRQQRQTDSSGQFRFPHLGAGSYLIAVQAHPWYAQNFPLAAQPSGNVSSTSGAELDVAYPLTYYPGAVDPAAAAAIIVAEGGASTIQIVLRPVSALHIKVTGVSSTPPMAMRVNVVSIAAGGFQSFSQPQISSSSDNSIEISGIAPGRYMVIPMSSGEEHGERLAPGIFDFTGNETLDISAFSRHSLSGRITFEGAGPPASHPRLFLSQPHSGAQLRVEPDGTFKLSQRAHILPGRYQLGLQNAPGFYIKSVEVNGAAVSSNQIEIPSSGAVQLSVVAVSGVTSLNGVALKEDKPASGAMVLLIPKDFARTDLIRRDQSDSDGTFTLPDVLPGRYTLLAIDNGRDLLYQDASSMKPYLSQGQDVTAPLPNGATLKVNLIARRPPAN